MKLHNLKSFIGSDQIEKRASIERIITEWEKFYSRNRNYRDLTKVNSLEEFKKKTDKDHRNIIIRNPVKYLIDSGKGYFRRGVNGSIELADELENYLGNETFIKHYKDILEFREKDYYYRRFRKNN